MRAEGVGRAHDGAEVVRVGDAVEDQQQRRAFDVFQHFVERLRQRNRFDARDNALMIGGLADQPGQAVGLDLCESDLVVLRLFNQIARPRITPGQVEVDFKHARRILPKPRQYGVKTVD